MQFFVSALAVLAAVTSVAAGPVFCNVVMTGKPVTSSLHGSKIGMELAMTSNGAAIITDRGKGFNTHIKIENGSIGFFRGCHYDWMNIGTSDKSYKPITFDLDNQRTHNWSIGNDGALAAAATPEYKETSGFLACRENGKYVIYLQTGNDTPMVGCTPTTLHVPKN